MTRTTIPLRVVGVVAQVLGDHYYSHSRLNTLFWEAGAPGDPPQGNCVDKCSRWLRRINDDPDVQPLDVLGRILAEFMEYDIEYLGATGEQWRAGRERIRKILEREGLSYYAGGRVISLVAGPPARALAELVRAKDLPAIQVEFERALSSLETDPPAAVTAACAILEALFKVYIEDEQLELPNSQTVKPLWAVVQKHLGLDPSRLVDQDLARILGGLSSVVDGIGTLRTHASSAHGRGRRAYRLAARHARLAVHAANTLAAFVLETWAARKVTPHGQDDG